MRGLRRCWGRCVKCDGSIWEGALVDWVWGHDLHEYMNCMSFRMYILLLEVQLSFWVLFCFGRKYSA